MCVLLPKHTLQRQDVAPIHHVMRVCRSTWVICPSGSSKPNVTRLKAKSRLEE